MSFEKSNIESTKKGNNDSKIETSINQFITLIRRKKISGMYKIASSTLEFVRTLLNLPKRKVSTHDIIKLLTKFAIKCQESLPSFVVIGNMVRRVLFIIRDQYARNKKSNKYIEDDYQPNLMNVLKKEKDDNFINPFYEIKSLVFSDIKELISEIDDTNTNLSNEAPEYIHSK
jgi:translation initiation factor eIF-2B subunit beta